MNDIILVIDDEKSVREIAGIMIEKTGNKALTAPDGLQGVDILANNPGIKLAFVDLNMPGLSGEDTISRLLEIKPDLKILILSGSSKNELAKFNDLKNIGFITKPFTYAVLKETIENFINR